MTDKQTKQFSFLWTMKLFELNEVKEYEKNTAIPG